MMPVQLLDMVLSHRASIVAKVETYATFEDLSADGTPLGSKAVVARPIWLTVAIGHSLASRFYN
jgi:hypothetical protein